MSHHCSVLSQSREYVPCRLAKYGTRLYCVGASLRQCGSVLIRTSVPCFGVPRYQLAWPTCQTQLYPPNGPKALEAYSFSLLKRPLPQPPAAGLGETAICLIVCRMKPGTWKGLSNYPINLGTGWTADLFNLRSASDELLSGVEPLPQPGTAAKDETSLKRTLQLPAHSIRRALL